MIFQLPCQRGHVTEIERDALDPQVVAHIDRCEKPIQVGKAFHPCGARMDWRRRRAHITRTGETA